MVNNPKLKEKGYDLARIGDDAPTGLDDPIKKGIDGIYKNADSPPQYVIDEAKFNTAQLGKTKSGKQMSDDWIKGSQRLEKQVGRREANKIMRAMKNNQVEKVVSRVDDAGNVVTKKLNKAGNIVGNWP